MKMSPLGYFQVVNYSGRESQTVFWYFKVTSSFIMLLPLIEYFQNIFLLDNYNPVTDVL